MFPGYMGRAVCSHRSGSPGQVAVKVAGFGEGKETRASAWSLAAGGDNTGCRVSGAAGTRSRRTRARGVGRGTWMWVTGTPRHAAHVTWISLCLSTNEEQESLVR